MLAARCERATTSDDDDDEPFDVYVDREFFFVRYPLNNVGERGARGEKGRVFSRAKERRSSVFNEVGSRIMSDTKPQHGAQDMKGWLFKWTNYLKGYQRRWFVLSNGLLSYYRYIYSHFFIRPFGGGGEEEKKPNNPSAVECPRKIIRTLDIALHSRTGRYKPPNKTHLFFFPCHNS